MSLIKIRKTSMHNNETHTPQTTPQFHMKADDRRLLEHLPWQVPLAEWPEHGVVPLSIRRGESRHPVIFVERAGFRYAIKETTLIWQSARYVICVRSNGVAFPH